jgi:hypothetical protein
MEETLALLRSLIMAVIPTLVMVPALTQADTPVMEWQSTFGTPSDERLGAMILLSENSIFLVGSSSSSGDTCSLFSIITDSSGRQESQGLLRAGPECQITGAVANAYGSVDVCGDVSDMTRNYHEKLFEVSRAGDTLWSMTYTAKLPRQAYGIARMSDSGLVVVGYDMPSGSDKNVSILLTDPKGHLRRDISIGSDSLDIAHAVMITNVNDVMVVGFTRWRDSDDDVYILMMSTAGDTIWTRTIGGPDRDVAWSVCQGDSDRFLIAGVTSSYGSGGQDGYVICIDAEGDTLWTHTYGGAKADGFYRIFRIPNGHFVLLGWSKSFGAGDFDGYAIEIDRDGRELWHQSFGGDKDDWFMDGLQTKDGRFFFAGITASLGAGQNDFWLVRITSP